MKRSLWLLLAVPLLTGGSGLAKELGACGDGRDINTVVASSSTGAVVGSGFARGVVVYLRGLSKADPDLVPIGLYAGIVLAEPSGERFAVREGKNLHLYSFSGFKRLAKSSAKVLKDQSVYAWHWIDGTDDVVFFSALVKEGMFGMSEKRTPHLLRINVATGAGTAMPLDLPKDPLSAAFDAKGERVALGFGDGHVEVRGTSDGKTIASYTGHDSPWNSLGLAFHPTRNLLASSDGSRLITFDLEKKAPQAVHKTQTGAKLLQFVAGGQFLIGGDTSTLALLDLQGRILESARTEETYEDFYVADSLRKVFTTGGDLVCWRTFERWEKTPVVAGGASPGGAAPAAADVTYRGVPLSAYVKQLKGKDVKAQLDAIYAIQGMGPVAAAAVPDLVPFLSAQDWFVRTAAMKALSEIGPASAPAAPRLAEALSDQNADVRRAAAQTLVKLGPAGKEAVPALVARIEEPIPDIRGHVLAALAAIGPEARSAVPALKAYLKKEQEQWLRNAADDALEKIQRK